MDKHKIAKYLILGGLALDVIDEITGSNTNWGVIYGGNNPLATLNSKLPIDPGLIMIMVGVGMMYF